MFKWIKASFWNTIAGLILRNRIAFLLLIIAITGGLVSQWKNVRFTFTEANMLPDDHPVNMEYKHFLNKFGEEGNLILMALDDEKIYTPEVLNKWIALSNELKQFKQIDAVISINNLPILVKDTAQQRFVTHKFIEGEVKTQAQADSLQQILSEKLPFYEGLIYNKKNNTLQTAVYMNKKIVNTQARKDFILNDFICLAVTNPLVIDTAVHKSTAQSCLFSKFTCCRLNNRLRPAHLTGRRTPKAIVWMLESLLQKVLLLIMVLALNNK